MENREQQTIEEVAGKHLYASYEFSNFFNDCYAAMREYASLQTDKLRQENAQLKEFPDELNRWINQEIDTAEAKLETLSPLGKHALQAPIKAQIALLKEVAEKFKIKSIQ